MNTNSKTLIDLPELQKAVTNITTNDRRETAENLLAQVIFLDSTLETLQASIDKDGAIIKVKRGQTETTKENPALRAYNTSIMRYCQLLKQLTDLLPKPEEKPESDPLMDFIAAHKK